MLSPHLTLENHVELLDRVRGMSKAQIEALVADLAPKPDVPARMRKVPTRRASTKSEIGDANREVLGAAVIASEKYTAGNAALRVDAVATEPLPAASSGAAQVQPLAAQEAASGRASTFALQSPVPRATCEPLGLDRFYVRLTLGREAHTALDQLVELFRHQNPSGDFTVIIERALCDLLENTMKRRFGQTKATQPRPTREPASMVPAKTRLNGETGVKQDVDAKTESQEVRSTKSRYIPRAVLREVHARDKGQCTYVSPDGRRCTERGFLEVHHHHTTFARGGEATTENLRLACRAHNRLIAERDYGRGFMQKKLHEAMKQPATRIKRARPANSTTSAEQSFRAQANPHTPRAMSCTAGDNPGAIHRNLGECQDQTEESSRAEA
jgi:hypothetical protein